MAAAALETAQNDGDKEAQIKLNKRTAHVTPEMNEEAKRLLRLMGIPVVQAPCEAEAQCARLCKEGKVWAAGTEDMDTLTCGTTRLLRHLTYAEARKMPILEIQLKDVLNGLGLTMDEVHIVFDYLISSSSSIYASFLAVIILIKSKALAPYVLWNTLRSTTTSKLS